MTIPAPRELNTNLLAASIVQSNFLASNSCASYAIVYKHLQCRVGTEAVIVGSRRDFDAMADACLEAGRFVTEHGSLALQRAMRLVLFLLGRELAERMSKRAGRNGEAENPDRPVRHDDEPSH